MGENKKREGKGLIPYQRAVCIRNMVGETEQQTMFSWRNSWRGHFCLPFSPLPSLHHSPPPTPTPLVISSSCTLLCFWCLQNYPILSPCNLIFLEYENKAHFSYIRFSLILTWALALSGSFATLYRKTLFCKFFTN